jgi:hypothetical protein
MNKLDKQNRQDDDDDDDDDGVDGNDDHQLHLYRLTDYEESNKIKKPQAITLGLIIERNLAAHHQKKSNSNSNRTTIASISSIKRNIDEEAELKAQRVLKLTHVRLDGERIYAMDNLAEYLGCHSVTHLYLNRNLIGCIENLDYFSKLKFLTLAHNRIRRVENLKSLEHLKILDLSFNLIDAIGDHEFDELPSSLFVLDLRGNSCLDGADACWIKRDYDGQIKSRLLRLVELNGQRLEYESDDNGLIADASDKDVREPTLKQLDSSFELLKTQIIERSRMRQRADRVELLELRKQRQKQLDLIKR